MGIKSNGFKFDLLFNDPNSAAQLYTMAGFCMKAVKQSRVPNSSGCTQMEHYLTIIFKFQFVRFGKLPILQTISKIVQILVAFFFYFDTLFFKNKAKTITLQLV